MTRARMLRRCAVVLSVMVIASCGGDATEGSSATTSLPTSTTAREFESLGESFYDPPDPLPEAPPGTLIRHEEFDGGDDVRAWRVLYHSRAVDGRDVAVSGVVFVPTGNVPPGGRPVLAAGPGTTGLADACSASKLEFGPPQEVMEPLLDSGFIVAITDYEGLGTPGVHPYGVGESAGRGLLDVARAALAVPGSQARPHVVLYGESQGGHAAYFAADIAAEYAPDVRVLGTVAQAPLLSLVNVMRLGSARPADFGFLMMFIVGLNTAHPDRAPLEAVLTEQGMAEREVVTKRCADDVRRHFSGRIDELLLKNPADVPSWLELLEANTLAAGRFDTPMLLTKGSSDEVLPKPLTDAFAETLCAAGLPLEYRVYSGASHASVTRAAADDVVRWVRERADSVPVQSTC